MAFLTRNIAPALFLYFVTLFAGVSFAQSQVAGTLAPSGCSEMFPFVYGRTSSFTVYNGANQPIGRLYYRNSNEQEGLYIVERYDAYNHFVHKTECRQTCLGDQVSMDMLPRALDFVNAYKEKNLSVGSNAITYPVTLTVGDALPDGRLYATGNDGFSTVAVSVDATDRKIVGVENITTGLGMYAAYRIDYKQTITTERGGHPYLFKTMMSEWVVPGIGVVGYKMMNADGKTLKSMLLVTVGVELPPPTPLTNAPTEVELQEFGGGTQPLKSE